MPTVDALEFDVRRGEVIGFLGPKDSGKSTTLSLIAGELQPTLGSVKVFNRSPRSARVRKRIAYLAQAGESRRGFWARLLGRASKTVGPTGAMSERRTKLSWIGRTNPELLILDQPLNGLDPANAEGMRDLILGFARRGRTVIISSLSLTEVMEICDRVFVLHRGRIEASGSVADILASPDALRAISPVLPKEIMERLLAVLRESIPSGGPLSEMRKPSTSQLISAAHGILENFVNPLKINNPLQHSDARGDPINHEKLEALAKRLIRTTEGI